VVCVRPVRMRRGLGRGRRVRSVHVGVIGHGGDGRAGHPS
jgi:hypothetical protein